MQRRQVGERVKEGGMLACSLARLHPPISRWWGCGVWNKSRKLQRKPRICREGKIKQQQNYNNLNSNGMKKGVIISQEEGRSRRFWARQGRGRGRGTRRKREKFGCVLFRCAALFLRWRPCRAASSTPALPSYPPVLTWPITYPPDIYAPILPYPPSSVFPPTPTQTSTTITWYGKGRGLITYLAFIQH